jgi:hypothetical protein
MPRVAQLATFVSLLFVASSCISPVVSGDYTLAADDIHEIQLLLWKRLDIPKPIGAIQVNTPTRAVVITGPTGHVGDTTFWIPVEKREGRWIVSPKSQWDRVTITAI